MTAAAIAGVTSCPVVVSAHASHVSMLNHLCMNFKPGAWRQQVHDRQYNVVAMRACAGSYHENLSLSVKIIS